MPEYIEINTNEPHPVNSNADQFYSDFWVDSDKFSQQSLDLRNTTLNRFFPEGLHGKRILEVGVGGEGGLIYLLKDKNDVYGYDVSDAAIRNCLRFGLNVTKVNLDRDKLLFEDNSLDVIFALEVFEHFSNPQYALEELRRVLKPGGTLLISTPPAVVYHWPRLFYPSLFEPVAFEEFLMVNGFAVNRHDNHLTVNLKPLPETARNWGWFWEARKPEERDAATFDQLGDYFWNQKNEYGMRRYPIEAIDLYRRSYEYDTANVYSRLKLTYALLYRAINGEPEFFELFDKIDLSDTDLTLEERDASFQTFCMIVLEADSLGVQIIDQQKLLVVREVAMKMGILG